MAKAATSVLLNHFVKEEQPEGTTSSIQTAGNDLLVTLKRWEIRQGYGNNCWPLLQTETICRIGQSSWFLKAPNIRRVRLWVHVVHQIWRRFNYSLRQTDNKRWIQIKKKKTELKPTLRKEKLQKASIEIKPCSQRRFCETPALNWKWENWTGCVKIFILAIVDLNVRIFRLWARQASHSTNPTND